MILYRKIDTETGEELAGDIKLEDLPTFILKHKDTITVPVEGQPAYDDDYFYVYVGGKWKRTSISNIGE